MQNHAIRRTASSSSGISQIATAPRHEVTSLAPTLLQRHRAWRATGHWAGSFSIAAWLRFPEGFTEVVRLMLSVTDQECHQERDDRERRKSYFIDRCLPNRQTLILLNGVVDLKLRGEVSDMSLYLRGPSDDALWMLDEYHIEANQSAMSKRSMSNPAVSKPAVSNSATRTFRVLNQGN